MAVQLDDYFSLPGTAGVYLSRADTNLLDADTAHLQQSIGVWSAHRRSDVPALSTALTPVYGDSHGSAEVTSAGADAVVRSGAATGGVFAVTAGVEYTASMSVSTDTAGREAKLGIFWYNSSNGSVGSNISADTALTVGSWTGLSSTGTAPGTAVWAVLYLYLLPTSGDVEVGDMLYWDAACIQAATASTFVPSIRIVGDVDESLVYAADDWTPSTDEVLIDRGGFKLTLDTSGDFIIDAWGDTATAISPLTALTNGTAYTIGVTGVESTGVVTLTIDGVSQGTDTLTPASPTHTALHIGASSTPGDYAAGKAYSYTSKDGSDGPTVAVLDVEDVGV